MSRSTIRILAGLVLLSVAAAATPSRGAEPPKPAVSPGSDGRLAYVTSERGDRIVDFSHAGYMGGNVPIPNAPVRVTVPAAAVDSTARIQAAIDYVASLPPDDRGTRGAVLLGVGRHQIAGALRISTSGVVLRGHGAGDNGTTLVATGQDRRTLITIAGADDRRLEPTTRPVADAYVPVNATRLTLSRDHGLRAGDTVVVRRPSTAAWIAAIGMTNLGGERHGFGWKPGSRDVTWDRTITAVDGDAVTLDAALTTTLDASFGGGTVARYAWPGRIRHVGVENLRCESMFDPANPKDEAHAWIAISIEKARDVWVRQVTFAHFAGSAVSILDSASRITVEDCKSLAPVSEIGGHRRHTFFTAGQQTLVQRCYSEHGRHDFAVGFVAAGPNAFVQCEAVDALADSGPIDSWASGVLYDNVRIDGNALDLHDRSFDAQGAGWAAANSVLWQCSAAVIRNFSPPTATNWSFGSWGQFAGDGVWYGTNDFVTPRSLYYAQLADRIGPNEATARADLMRELADGSTSPSVEEAAELTAASTQPAPQLSAWIDEAPKRRPIPADAGDANSIDDIVTLIASTSATRPTAHELTIRNGWLVTGESGALLVGGRQEIQWWRGSMWPDEAAKSSPSITRFAPGRIGVGYTDDLDALTSAMLAGGDVALEHHYGLWYDRRRDDHQRVRRMDGDVWPPFFEQPFARSGVGIAWDGLSKYDLTKYNPWYWSRLQTFADFADRKGLVLVHHHFFQHNILEAGAHWADSPWRTANNINDTGFPEPPPYAGDKRIFLAEQFYDVTHPARRELYRRYIRQCLDATSANANVIHLTSAEYTGPLHFMQFWLDCAAEWQRETGKRAIIGLSATKDVQDAILADPARAAVVSLIDIRYWRPQADGSFYAPKGGENLAPRQHARLSKAKPASFASIVRAVREYHEKFPDKPVIYSADGGGDAGWAVLMGGGSLANVKIADPQLLAAIPMMRPVESAGEGQWLLSDPGRGYLAYSETSDSVRVDLPSEGGGGFTATFVDPRDGRAVKHAAAIGPGAGVEIKPPGVGPWVVWLRPRS
jgi:hypothetical protein